jgi:xylan 1,4-beta-xylosidase
MLWDFYDNHFMKSILALSLAALASVTYSSSIMASENSRIISADLSHIQGPFGRMGNLCVGAGRANEGLRADWQRQLAVVHNECGFRYVRFHGLFCDDMGVVLWDNSKKQFVYNWQYVDELFDSMLASGVRPFVELGFMPTPLASGSATIFWWKGNVTPPKDYGEWESFIRAAVTHWTERYGEREVAQWYFEVWNEPNLAGFWTGNDSGKNDEELREEYFKLYDATAKVVKSVRARYRVGGPATAGNGWVSEMIDHCAKSGAPIDFVSTHNYAVTAGYLDEAGSAGTVFCPSRDAMIAEVKGSREKIAASALPKLELHYTEWSASYTPSDPIHDSYVSAAFILNKLKGVGGAAQSMSYWTFTDIFEEAGPRATPFHGGFGLLNYQGIRKSAFFAYQFLNKLGPAELKCDDSDAWVTTDGKGGIQALFWDFSIIGPTHGVNDQEYFNRDLPAKDARLVILHVSGLKEGEYKLAAYRVGYRSNDAYTAYLDIGAPSQLTRAQVVALNKASSGAPFAEEVVRIGKDGVFEHDYVMRENDVILVTLDPRR